MRYRVWWVGSFFVLAALLVGCATAPKPAPPDAGLDYAMAVEDFRLLHIHEVCPATVPIRCDGGFPCVIYSPVNQ